MASQRTHVVLRSEMVAEIDKLAIRRAAGAWQDEHHPDLAEGSARYVRRLRLESERRLGRSGQRP
jgi:hypothetical protein